MIGYSYMFALTRSSRKAVLKNWTRNVTVVVFIKRFVSVLNPTQSISMIQAVLSTKLMPVSTYDRPVGKSVAQSTWL